MAMTIRIETTGNISKSGVSAKGNEYIMCEAFAHIPGVPYPQMFDYYAAKRDEVLPAGNYECDVTCKVKDGRLSFDCDPRQARRLQAANKPAVQAAG